MKRDIQKEIADLDALSVHPGWHLIEQAVQEEIEEEQVILAAETQMPQIFRCQGRIQVLQSLLRYVVIQKEIREEQVAKAAEEQAEAKEPIGARRRS